VKASVTPHSTFSSVQVYVPGVPSGHVMALEVNSPLESAMVKASESAQARIRTCTISLDVDAMSPIS